jgi:H+/Cl- antiporter ClcA
MLSENPKGLINDGWLDFGLMPAMTVFFVVKFVMLALIVSFPGPTGVFMPTLAAGSVLGRFFGELYASFAAYDTTGSS